MHRSNVRRPVVLLLTLLLPALFDISAPAAEELDYWEYEALAETAHRLNSAVMVEPPEGETGLYLVLADRFGIVHAYLLTHGEGREVWKSRVLDGLITDMQKADLDGDGHDEVIAITGAGRIYVWHGPDFRLLFENLTGEFRQIHSFTTGNVDDDEAWEIIVNADRLIYYVDGVSFTREWSSTEEYETTRIRCGDVDGDGRNELVLGTGQVVDSKSGGIEWDEEVFGNQLVLMDFDGDGILEVLAEREGGSLRVFDIDTGREKRFQ